MMKSLVATLAILAGTHSFAQSTDSCFDFAYSKYLPELGTEDAPRFAREACERVSDVKVLAFLWGKHAQKFSPAHSMDFATEEKAGSLNGKYDLLEVSWVAYHIAGLNPSAAATKAAAGCARISSLTCLIDELMTVHGNCKLETGCVDNAFDVCEARK